MITLIRNIFARALRHRVLGQSAELAFYLLLSFFPCLIILTRFVVYAPIKSALLGILNTLLPTAAADLIAENILSLEGYPLLPTGVLLLIYAASRGINTLIFSSGSAYEVQETRSFLWRFFLRFLLLPMALFLGAFGVFFLLLLNKFFQNIEILYPLWEILRYPAALAFGALATAVLYRFLPNIHTPFYRHLPGALFATTAGIIASEIFSRFADISKSYSAYYGSMTGVIILLLWLFLCSNILILGMEINAEIYYKGRNAHEQLQSNTNA